MSGGLHKIRTPGSLKEASAQLVVACGGQTEASGLCRVSKSQIARYTDESDENALVHMPIDVVMVLEHHCRQPIVTRYLAIAQNAALVELVAQPREAYGAVLARIGQETGELFAKSMGAKADGSLSLNEAGEVRREAMDLMNACATLVANLAPKDA